MSKSDTKLLDEWINKPYTLIAAICTVSLIAGVTILEQYTPYNFEMASVLNLAPGVVAWKSYFDVTSIGWPPIIAGICIGLLQLPSSKLLGKFSYCFFIDTFKVTPWVHQEVM